MYAQTIIHLDITCKCDKSIHGSPKSYSRGSDNFSCEIFKEWSEIRGLVCKSCILK